MKNIQRESENIQINCQDNEVDFREYIKSVENEQENIRFKTKNNNSSYSNISNNAKKKLKIMIVDDESLIRKSHTMVVTRYFESKNIEVIVEECDDGFECINTIYKGLTNNIQYDYVFTDQTMEYMTGTTLAETISVLRDRGLIKNIKVYLVTSYTEDMNQQNGSHNHIIDIIPKPLSISKLKKMNL